MMKTVLSALVICLLVSAAQAESPKATGELNCKQSKAQPYFPCPFVAYREGQGAARVEITFPDGSVRTIVYKGGKMVSTDGNTSFSVEKFEDLATIRIGNESYEIVDAIPFGG